MDANQQRQKDEELRRFVAANIAASFPRDMELTPVEWAVKHVRLPGSELSDRFDPSVTPWTKDPINTLKDSSVRVMTAMAPVQSGKSVIGEVGLCYAVSTSGGNIQSNWESNSKANDIYEKRIEKTLLSCPPVKARWPSNPNKAKKGLVVFPHANLIVQGQEVSSNLDSDTVRWQFNEEIHNWHDGHLQKAGNRLTAVWNAKQINLSNAGNHNDQLHVAYLNGTQERWAMLCPCCNKLSPWHTRRLRDENREWKWGGLLYDSKEAKRGKWDYDYEKINSTLRYQCDHCGHEIREHERPLITSMYLQSNDSPLRGHRSFSWDAVAVPYIPWISLVQEKHRALKALSYGDRKPWRIYVTERECIPFDENDIPMTEKISLSTGIRKVSIDSEEFDHVAATVDVQAGAVDDVPHHWVVIRGYKENKVGIVRASMIFEGRVDLMEEVDELIDRHGIFPGAVFVDSGDRTQIVYRWCGERGYIPIKGRPNDDFVVDTGEEDSDGEAIRVRRIWRESERPVELKMADGSRKLLPLVLYSKGGIRERLEDIRSSPMWQWEIPEDVSDDFVNHYAAETMQTMEDGKRVSKQTKRRNDLYVCDCYQALAYDIHKWSMEDDANGY